MYANILEDVKKMNGVADSLTKCLTKSKKRIAIWNLSQIEAIDPEARLLDLRKAHPRVKKTALWETFCNYRMEGPFQDSLVDLHEATDYQNQGKEED